MSAWKKALLLQLWFFIGLPLLGLLLYALLGLFGALLFVFLFVIWCWEIFAFSHYRHCRQEEFLQVLQTAAATQAPVEAVLRAYLRDRPREHLYRAILLFFVFPGYYWIHVQRSFDHRVSRLLAMLDSGLPLDQALHFVPGVVSRETALALTAGSFVGKLTDAFKRLSDRRQTPLWLELAPRFLYPVLVLFVLGVVMVFTTIFVIPKYEKILLDFKMKLPASTEILIAVSRWFIVVVSAPFDFSRQFLNSTPAAFVLWLLVLLLFVALLMTLLNVLLFSSRVHWHFPLVSWVYRLHARGLFLGTLGQMMETGKPLPEILTRMLATKLLPAAVASRAERLAADLAQGQPLAASLARHGLITAPLQGLIASAEKAQNLPWALQELGDSLMRRSDRVLHRLTMVLFPLILFAIACLVGFFAVSMFSPLVVLLDGMHG